MSKTKPTARRKLPRTFHARKPRPNGAIFYQGPSLIDGAPIVAIVTGLAKGSTNTKTGAMLQTWILRADISPTEAVRTGADVSVCGDCPLRGIDGVGRECYVTVVQAPLAVYKSFRAGKYTALDMAQLAGRTLRVGSYGDPAAIPADVWHAMLAAGVQGWTGYTHQWRTADSLRSVVMASADTEWERDEAHAAGWRTFRVRADVSALDTAREIACPASAEMGHRVTCDDCRLCTGTTSGAKSIAILPHGTNKGAIIPLASLRAAISH